MRKFFNTKSLILAISILFLASMAWAGTPQLVKYGLKLADEGAAKGTPSSGYGYLYVYDDVLYFKTDGGVATNLLSAASLTYDAISDPVADSSITFADNEINVWTFADTN